MNAAQHRALMIGLPAAGKTTFLAALYHVLESEETDAVLKLERLHGDHKHLSEIRGLWADAQELDRTKIADEQVVSMLVRDVNSQALSEVVLPDLSGETFEGQWADRQMKPDFAELTAASNGGVLFIHPAKVKEEILIPDTHGIVGQLQRARPAEPSSPPHHDESHGMPDATLPDETATWAAEHAPTAVKLVELLQFVARLNTRRPFMLSVVVSAWDTLGDGAPQPSEWISRRLPLVWQYLAANTETFATKYFGVSAQGADLRQADQLREVSPPAKRIRVVDDDLHKSHDITAPVRWALGWGGHDVSQ